MILLTRSIRKLGGNVSESFFLSNFLNLFPQPSLCQEKVLFITMDINDDVMMMVKVAVGRASMRSFYGIVLIKTTKELVGVL